MTIPNEIRPALREELDALARGERPALLTWVDNYGHGGTEHSTAGGHLVTPRQRVSAPLEWLRLGMRTAVDDRGDSQ